MVIKRELKFASIQGKLIIAIVLVSIILSTFSGLVFYMNYENTLMSDLKTRIINITTTAAISIDVTKHQEILKSKDMDSTDYLAMKHYLQKIQEENDLACLYTFAPLDQNAVQFVVDADPEGGVIGERYECTPRMQEVFAGVAVAEDEITQDKWGDYLSAYAPIKDANGVTIAAIGGDISADTVNDLKRALLIKVISIVMGSIVLGFLFAVFISRQISRPIVIVSAKIDEIAGSGGDLTQRIYINSEDETGKLADSTNKLIEFLQKTVREINDNTINLQAFAQELLGITEQFNQANEQVASNCQLMANQSANSFDTINHTVTVIENMLNQTKDVAARANQCQTSVQNTDNQVQRGVAKLEEGISELNRFEEISRITESEIDKLNDRSEKIGDIVGIITSIADQTNMLALNAAIEAARAGEQGRGFSVVAEEVRRLAEQVTASTGDIQHIVTEIKKDISAIKQSRMEGSKQITKTHDTFKEGSQVFDLIAQNSRQALKDIMEISSAAEVLTERSMQVGSDVQMMRDLAASGNEQSQSISAAVEENIASIQQINSSAEQLSAMVNNLQQVVALFKI